MNKVELKKMDRSGLEKHVVALRKELFELKLGAASSHVKDNSLFNKLKVGIARTLTLLNEKKES